MAITIEEPSQPRPLDPLGMSASPEKSASYTYQTSLKSPKTNDAPVGQMQDLPVPGLQILRNFITPSHERELISTFRALEWPDRQGRKSLHWGYTFSYKTFGIDKEVPFKEFPGWLVPLLPSASLDPSLALPPSPASAATGHAPAFEASPADTDTVIRTRQPDQVCLQYYPPGTGIPPHADTHSVFDQLYALSFGAPVMMVFREGNINQKVDVDLEPRALIKLGRDARQHWSHGIRAKKSDAIQGEGGGGAGGEGVRRERGERWSLTYRWLRDVKGTRKGEGEGQGQGQGQGQEGEEGDEGPVCECGDVRLCDTAQKRAGVERELRWKVAAQEQGQEAGSKVNGESKAGGQPGAAADTCPEVQGVNSADK